MGSRADRLNRVLLSVLGVTLLALGTTGLLLGSGVLGERFERRRVLSDDVVGFVEDNAAWVWPVAAAGALLLALPALRWLLQQLRTDRIPAVDLTEDRKHGETAIATGALTDALVDAVEQSAGVDDASARFVREHGRDLLLVHVRLADRTDLAAARRALADGPLADLRRLLGETATPDVRIELEPSTKGNGRVLT
jgi:hypothetical protein